jgi:hypothetical protein
MSVQEEFYEYAIAYGGDAPGVWRQASEAEAKATLHEIQGDEDENDYIRNSVRVVRRLVVTERGEWVSAP